VTTKEFRKKINTKFWHCSKCNEEIALPFNHIVDERVYLLELYKMSLNREVMPTELIENQYDHLVFNPLVDIPSDIYNTVCNNNTEYYTEDTIDEISKKNSGNNLSMLNVNIRSTNKNFDTFKDFLHSCNLNFNIIGLVETWLKDTPHDYFQLDGFNLELTNRQNNRGGGVCIYIDDGLKYIVRKTF